MLAMRIHQLGQPMQLDTISAPVPGPGEVLLDVHACGVNFADTLIVDGKYQEKPPLPFSPGMEMSGVIHAVGPDVSTFVVGQRVASFSGTGGFSQQTCVDVTKCVPIPDQMSDEQAAGFLVAYGTAHVALAHRAALAADETLLVLGASGGIGMTAIELGKIMGATVIAIARGAEKLKVCADAGADHLIDSETADIRAAVKALGGADVIYDPVGGAQFDAAFRAINPGGRILPLGFASGDIPQIPANILLVKNLTVHGVYWGGYPKLAPNVLRDSFTELFDWFVQGKLHPHISHVLPLDQAGAALDLLRNRKATGKVVVSIPH